MIPKQTGYYWLKLSPGSNWQVVYVIRGEDICFAGLLDRTTKEQFPIEYPQARWSERLEPPTPIVKTGT